MSSMSASSGCRSLRGPGTDNDKERSARNMVNLKTPTGKVLKLYYKASDYDYKGDGIDNPQTEL